MLTKQKLNELLKAQLENILDAKKYVPKDDYVFNPYYFYDHYQTQFGRNLNEDEEAYLLNKYEKEITAINELIDTMYWQMNEDMINRDLESSIDYQEVEYDLKFEDMRTAG